MDISMTLQMKASAHSIFRAISSQDGIRSWWCKVCDISEGTGNYCILNFIKEGNTVVMEFQVTELVQDTKLVWKCVNNGSPAWINTKLIYQIESNGTLHFTHAGFDEKWKGLPPYEDTINGWKHFMESLKNYCETGSGEPW